ncbi:MAG TPA: hydrolase [Planctomycetota bacterium]|nr:hydrolase [Planctomycetota bacterium]
MVSPAYRAPLWLPGRHAQSIYPYLFLRPPPVPYRRERVATPDGDFVDFDWLQGAGAADDSPVVVLFHGLEGSSRSHYATALMRAATREGWRGVVPHWRGCSGEPNHLPRAYHSGDHAEVGWMMGVVRARIGQAPAFAVGVSLGGSALLNWLGREGGNVRRWLTAAAAVSAPIDLVASGSAIDRGLNRVYALNFLRTLIPKALAKDRRFPGLIDGAALRRARTLRAFDDLVTAPLHGFRSAEDYWTRGSSRPHLREIAIPTLALNARNDPFIPGGSLPGPGEVGEAVTLQQPAHGGHVGFADGPFPGRLDWLTRRLLQFFESVRPRSTKDTAPPGMSVQYRP